jgi:two-component system chemotaxis response regulator CheB
MSQYNILVVDDSAFMRKIITDIISEESDFHVIYAAKNGAEAVEKTKELKPDLITMDIEMPIMNGLEALKIIMRDHPTPVVMLSSLTHDGAAETVQALEIGAVDFIQKPSGSISLDLYKVKRSLIEKLRIAVQTTNLKEFSPDDTYLNTTNRLKKTEEKKWPQQKNNKSFTHIVAVGTSTGGPKALHVLITQMPKNFTAPILVVQHMPPKFTKSLAQRLDSLSAIRVVEAEDESLIESGTAYIAPGGVHMTLTKDRNSDYHIRLSEEEPRNGHRPSVDTLFDSLIAHNELKRHIIIMTGMGSDGAKGMKLLKEAGAESTIAESHETCVVYGMPRAAIELKAADHVLPLYQIPLKLTNLVH